MFNLQALTGYLDKVAQNTGRIAANLPLALTELGYETNPPDRFAGIALDKQAEYINDADILGYYNPRVIANTQFLLRDVPPDRSHTPGGKAYWHTYESGLFQANGTPKPAAAASRLPFVPYPLGRDESGAMTEAIWGQLRFRPKGTPDT